jgi:PDDEXK-like domain of unknown function (DUF3799)
MTPVPVADANYGDVILKEPADAYHARRSECLSSHQLADFRKCPLLYHRRLLGYAPQEDRPSYLVGRAAHTLILEGLDRFADEYAVGGPVNPKTGAPYGSGTKAWSEWAEAQGKAVLTHEQAEVVTRMNLAVRSHAGALALLADGVPEGVVRAVYCEVPCQIRMDWFDPHLGIVDLKTCDDLTWFEADARRYDYAYQLTFYRAVLARVIGLPMPIHLIAVEKKEPFRCGVWRVDAQVLAIAQRENETAIARLRRCRAANHWPTGYEETRLFDGL